MKLEQINMVEFSKAEKDAYIKGTIGLNELVTVVVSFVVIAIVAGFGVIMLSKLKNSTTDADAQSAISEGITATKTVTSYLDLIALAVVIGIILTIVLVYLYRRFA